jgi:hypothetical protein
MHNVQNLISQLARVNVTAMRMIGYERDVKGADVRYVRKTLKKVVLLIG